MDHPAFVDGVASAAVIVVVVGCARLTATIAGDSSGTTVRFVWYDSTATEVGGG